MNAILATTATAEPLTMSSREIAKLTGKRHTHVLRDIREMLESLGDHSAQFSAEYRDKTGRALPGFNLPRRECLILVSGYDIHLRARIIDRWIELETAAAAQTPEDRRLTDWVAAIKIVGEYVATAPGVKPGIAAACTLRMIEDNTGIRTEQARLALPPAEGPRCTLNATALGALLGFTARETNRRLEAAGLQFKNVRDEWQLTDKGRDYGEEIPFARSGHAGYQVQWAEAAADLIYGGAA